MEVIVALIVILILAKGLGELFERVGYPSMVGEILAGVILGPSLLGLVEFNGTIRLFADLGIIALLFISGAEMNLDSLARSRRSSASAAIGGVVVPFGLGLLVGLAFHLDWTESVFLGTVLSVTSIGISVRTLLDLKSLKGRIGSTIVEAAIFDDVIGIVLLALLSSFALAGGQGVLETFLPMLAGAVILILLVTVGRGPVASLYDRARRASTHEMSYAVAILIGLILATVTHLSGLHYAIGAFVAGLIIGPPIRKNIHLFESLSDFAFGFMATFFFASVGLLLHLSVDHLTSLLVPVTVVLAILGKVLGGYLGALRPLGREDALTVGIGLVPRGEVALIIANIALIQGVIGDKLFTAVTVVVLVSILVTPTLLKGRLG
ncbi:MAG: cation:proton antiporter [Methanomassiliicoccales archaeon]